MYDDLSLLLRPVEEGMVPYQAIHETTLTLYDFGVMHDYLAVRDENRHRWQDWVERNKPRH